MCGKCFSNDDRRIDIVMIVNAAETCVCLGHRNPEIDLSMFNCLLIAVVKGRTKRIMSFLKIVLITKIACHYPSGLMQNYEAWR